MRTLSWLILASLLANIAIGWGIVRRSHHIAVQSGSDATLAAPSASQPVPISAQSWEQVSAGTPAETLARLRAAGYPVPLQRAILAVLIRDQFAAGHHEIALQIAAFPWWHGNIYASAQGAAVVAARQKLARDEKAALDQLLGPDAGASDFAREEFVRRNGNLPLAKMSALDRLNSDYDELVRQVRNASNNILLPEDREKLALLDQEKNADLAALLTPDELYQYRLHSSPTASLLKTQLAAFAPSEDEYRNIFQVVQGYVEKMGDPSLMNADQRQQWVSAQPAMLSELGAVLPPDRLADFKLKTDSTYIQANAVVSRLGLPDSATADIVAVQKDISTRASAVRADASLAPDTRAAQLSALGAEANARLGATLGPAGLAVYQQTAGGWIATLLRPPAPAPVKH